MPADQRAHRGVRAARVRGQGPADLSSGQRQRLSLAAALARPSRLLLLDEPEQSLAPGFRKELVGLLREHAGHGGTVVVTTHDLGFAAAAGARLMLIADGRMAVLGRARDRGGDQVVSSAGDGAGPGTTGIRRASPCCWP